MFTTSPLMPLALRVSGPETAPTADLASRFAETRLREEEEARRVLPPLAFRQWMKTLSDYGEAARTNAPGPPREAGATEQDQTNGPKGPFRAAMASDEAGSPPRQSATPDTGLGDQPRA